MHQLIADALFLIHVLQGVKVHAHKILSCSIMLVLLWLYHVGTTDNLQLDESHFISVSIFNFVCIDARKICNF